MTKCKLEIKNLSEKYKIGDCFISTNEQIVMITYDKYYMKYSLVVIAENVTNEKSNIICKGNRWDSRIFETLDEINEFINESEYLTRHIRSFTVIIND